MKKKAAMVLLLALILLPMGIYLQRARPHAFFQYLNISTSEVVKAHLYYQMDVDTQTEVILTQETSKLAALLQYLDCTIERQRFPIEAYEPDRLSIVLETDTESKKLQLISTPSALFLYDEGKTYQLMIRAEQVETLLSLPQEKWIDLTGCDYPLYCLFQWAVTNHDGKGIEVIRSETIGGMPLLLDQDGNTEKKSLDEIIAESEIVVTGTLAEQRYLDHYWNAPDYIQGITALPQVETFLKVMPRENAGAPLVVRIPGGIYDKKHLFLRLGPTEHLMTTEKTYLFFLKKNDMLEGVHEYVLANESFGIMEVLENQMIRPVFSIDIAEIGEYYISMRQLENKLHQNGKP